MHSSIQEMLDSSIPDKVTAGQACASFLKTKTWEPLTRVQDIFVRGWLKIHYEKATKELTVYRVSKEIGFIF